MSAIVHVSPSTVPAPRGGWSTVSLAPISNEASLCFVAGQVGEDSDGVMVGPGLMDQTSQAFTNIEMALAAVGGTLRDVVSFTTFLRDGVDVNEFKRARDSLVSSDRFDAPPTGTTVVVSSLARDGILVEIQAVAVIGGT